MSIYFNGERTITGPNSVTKNIEKCTLLKNANDLPPPPPEKKSENNPTGFFEEKSPQMPAPVKQTVNNTMADYQKEWADAFEAYFHVKFQNIQQMSTYLREKELDFQSNLKICHPGIYKYGTTSWAVIFRTSEIKAHKNGKCIVDTMSVNTSPSSPVVTLKCQFTDEYLKLLAENQDNPSAERSQKLSIMKFEQCKNYVNGELNE